MFISLNHCISCGMQVNCNLPFGRIGFFFVECQMQFYRSIVMAPNTTVPLNEFELISLSMANCSICCQRMVIFFYHFDSLHGISTPIEAVALSTSDSRVSMFYRLLLKIKSNRIVWRRFRQRSLNRFHFFMYSSVVVATGDELNSIIIFFPFCFASLTTTDFFHALLSFLVFDIFLFSLVCESHCDEVHSRNHAKRIHMKLCFSFTQQTTDTNIHTHIEARAHTQNAHR